MTLATSNNAPSIGRRTAGNLLLLPLITFFGVAFLALGYIAFVLWPRWPEPAIEPDAPPLPIVVGGVLFNIAPAAIRMPVQRRSGEQERIDLAYLWPSLTPPDAGTIQLGERVFVTIAVSTGTLSPQERIRAIYPRYTEPNPSDAPEGLTRFGFQTGSPYQGEDLIFDTAAPEHFLARCSRKDLTTPGTCLYERRIGDADLTVRFPRDWLDRWRTVSDGIDRLIAQWRPTANSSSVR